METCNRRPFAADKQAPTATEDAFRAAAERHGIPAAVAEVSDAHRPLTSCTYGPVGAKDIFAIASMTKAITSAAALQLVEQDILDMDAPAHAYLPELRDLPILEGFDPAGAPQFSRARYAVTLRQLLNHTAGFAYPWNHPLALRYAKTPAPIPFLVHQPGTRWHYGTNVDWVGRVVEAVSGQTLESYLQTHILRPLAMGDTSFLLPPEKLERLVTSHQRHADGALVAIPRTQPPVPAVFNGGGGLFSTAEDYTRFLRMILRQGRSDAGERILSERTVQLMSSNQVGELDAGRITSTILERSRDVDFHPGARDCFGLGFLINRQAYDGGRSAGSLAWAGIRNTFYWIDPERGIAAVLLMQFQPFCDSAALGMLRDFERAVYAGLQ